jgi:hypothetical protein
VSSFAAFGQEVATPVIESGFNYSFTRVNAGASIGSYTANGGSGDVEYNLNKAVGMVADLDGNYVGNANELSLSNTTFISLFGPRFNWRVSRVTTYVQTLVGGARFSNALDSNLPNPILGGSRNGFAGAIGGIAVKPFQVEYLITETPSAFSNVNHAQNNLRYSAGLVFRFGPNRAADYPSDGGHPYGTP